MRFPTARSIDTLIPLLALIAGTAGCQSATPVPLAPDAANAARGIPETATVTVSSTGAPSASQTLPGGYAVSVTFPTVDLLRRADGTIAGGVRAAVTIAAPGTPPQNANLTFVFSCMAVARRGNAIHVYAQGMATGAPGVPPGVAAPSYVYLVDDPAGDKMWSGPLGALGACVVPTMITNPDGSMGPVALQPAINGTIRVSIR